MNAVGHNEGKGQQWRQYPLDDDDDDDDGKVEADKCYALVLFATIEYNNHNIQLIDTLKINNKQE